MVPPTYRMALPAVMIGAPSAIKRWGPVRPMRSADSRPGRYMPTM
jgi:hypothetical protein